MFTFDVFEELSIKIEGKGLFYAKKGSMIAYQGDFKFDKVLIDTNQGGLAKGLMNLVARKLTGENMEIMKVNGQGAIYLSDQAKHVTKVTMDRGRRGRSRGGRGRIGEPGERRRRRGRPGRRVFGGSWKYLEASIPRVRLRNVNFHADGGRRVDCPDVREAGVQG